MEWKGELVLVRCSFLAGASCKSHIHGHGAAFTPAFRPTRSLHDPSSSLSITLRKINVDTQGAMISDRISLTFSDLACGTGKYTHLLFTLGATRVTGYDISQTMISGALATYPPSDNPNLHFGVADCSILESFPASGSGTFDLVFSAWFLNYAGSERELTNMFRVIEAQMAPGGRFVGLTTDVHDPHMSTPKLDFYGLDILVLDAAYVAPDSGEVVGIKAKIKVGKAGFEFDCFQFKEDVYSRCARRAGLQIRWRDCIVPDDERKKSGYWQDWLARPTFAMLEATRLEQ